MSTTWIGNIIESPDNEITDSNGEGVYSLLDCQGEAFNQVSRPELALKFPLGFLPNMTTLDSNAPFKVLADYVSLLGYNLNQNVASFVNPQGVTGLWTLGDGASTTDVDPVHEYAVHGTYFANLNSTDYVDVNIPAKYPPVASFQLFVDELIVACYGGSSSTLAPPLSYYWDFGDGGTGEGESIAYEYTSSGDKVVTLTVVDANGEWNTSQYTTFVNDLPVASFTHFDNLLAISFTNTSTDLDRITNSYWNMGDGTLSYSSNPTHTYAVGGTYDVSLVVKDEYFAESIPYVQTITVSSTWTTLGELLPTDVSNMDSDILGITGGAGMSRTFGGGECACSATQSYGRFFIKVDDLGLEIGKRYLFKARIKVDPAAVNGDIRSFTWGNISGIPLIRDGEWHDYEGPVICTATTGECRVSCYGDLIFDSASLAEIV